MVRKIKVVDINEIKPIESINPNTIGNVILNDEEDIIEVEIPHAIPDDVIIGTSSIDEAPRSLQDLVDEIVKITKETNEELKHITPRMLNETLSITRRPSGEKDIEKIPCPNCFKMMSVKSLKYSHQKNCKTFKTSNKPKEEPPTPEPVISVPIPELPKPILNKPVRATRSEIKQQRLNNLISQAF